jgi:DNA-binding CsgD family transcriptional regulator
MPVPQSPSLRPLAIESIVQSEAWGVLVRSLGLSPRETEIIERILRFDHDELSIARHLKISSHTVHTHLERLYRKLHVSSRCQLVTRIFVAYAGHQALGIHARPAGATSDVQTMASAVPPSCSAAPPTSSPSTSTPPTSATPRSTSRAGWPASAPAL